MKKIILFIWFLSALQLKSQQFFDSSVYYLTIGFGNTIDDCCYHSYYRMILDSTSNDTEYYSCLNNRDDLSKAGAFKDAGSFKVINKRVYIYGEIDGGTAGYFLLYDFNLQAGDSARVSGFNSMIDTNSLLIVDSVKNIQLGPFIYKAQYVRVYGLLGKKHYTFVENIGSLENGFYFYAGVHFESGSHLINLCKNDTLLYWERDDVVKSGGNTCSPVFVSGIAEAKLAPKPFIYPNPSRGVIQIYDGFMDSEAAILEVYSIAGQLLKTFSIENTEKIDLGDINAGLYCVRLISSNGKRQQILSID